MEEAVSTAAFLKAKGLNLLNYLCEEIAIVSTEEELVNEGALFCILKDGTTRLASAEIAATHMQFLQMFLRIWTNGRPFPMDTQEQRLDSSLRARQMISDSFTRFKDMLALMGPAHAPVNTDQEQKTEKWYPRMEMEVCQAVLDKLDDRVYSRVAEYINCFLDVCNQKI